MRWPGRLGACRSGRVFEARRSGDGRMGQPPAASAARGVRHGSIAPRVGPRRLDPTYKPRATNCASCVDFNLAIFGLPQPCLSDINGFNSVGISQPSAEGLPFAVLVGPPGCESFAQFPTVNECFNVNGGPWDQWALEN